jgi:methylenetetrahydrofolate dehydrogenase (NADP+)/methenyltetrahydrofolate cyclohydrolase
VKLDGRLIAENILEDLKTQVSKLREKGIVPTLLVVLIGNDEQSIAYVKQKEIKAAQIGARTEVLTFDHSMEHEEARDLLKKLNADKNVHGIIIQRPAPENLKVDELSELIDAKKEVDGFGNNSPYVVPVAQAVRVLISDGFMKMNLNIDFDSWLKKQNIVVMGKGETAGKPIINYLKKLGVNPQIIDSKTQSPKQISKQADILISCVGKDKTVTPDMIKKGAILIGVGLNTNNEGKLRGDFHADEIRDIVSFYSPTPGGVGPVNVASLLSNLVSAASQT